MQKMKWRAGAAMLHARLRRFYQTRNGNVAAMFALALVPLVAAGGAGVDYIRAASVRSQMGEALDAAALAVGSTTGLNQTSAASKAQEYFDASFGDTSASKPVVTVNSYDPKGSVSLAATYNVQTSLLKVVGINTVPLTATSSVVWGQSKLWVALALDNSGSMAQGDSGGSKMDALQDALTNTSYGMLTKLQGASATPGDVQVGIVPFTRSVDMGYSAFAASTSIDWGEWDAPPAVPGVTTIKIASPSTTYADDVDITNQNKSSGSTISTIKFAAWGPGDNCPFTTSSNNQTTPFGFYCMITPTNGASKVTAIPASGGYKGYICPGIDSGTYNPDHNDRYYNGCYTSTKVTTGTTTITVNNGSNATCNGFTTGTGGNCTCSGSGSSKVCKTQKWAHAWVPNNHTSWSGCVMDRQQKNKQTTLATGTGVNAGLRTAAIIDYDTSKTLPASSTPDSQFPAENAASCLAATVTTLGYNWASLSSQVNAMSPNGSTNQAIGVEHAWQMLTPGAPYSTPTVPVNTSRYIILFSDGLNTQDRWYGDGSTEGNSDDAKIDARMATACSNAKADGIVIYTLFIHIGTDGDSTALENCATDASKYFDLTSSSQIATAFSQIAQQITNVRVSR